MALLNHPHLPTIAPTFPVDAVSRVLLRRLTNHHPSPKFQSSKTLSHTLVPAPTATGHGISSRDFRKASTASTDGCLIVTTVPGGTR